MNKFALIFLSLSICIVHCAKHSEEDIKNYLAKDYEKEASELCNEQVKATFMYETDLTAANSEKLVEATLKASKRSKEIHEEWFKDVKLDDIEDETLKRQLKNLKTIGSMALNEEDLQELTAINSFMMDTYSKAKICPFEKQNCNLESEGLNLEPDIESIMASSKDYDKLLYTWTAWHDKFGKASDMASKYSRYVALNNKAASLNGFVDNGAMWRDTFETPDFIEKMDKLWEQVKPLYVKLHQYTRNKLIKIYGEDKIGTDDHLIPAHLLGNMWAQTWTNLEGSLTAFTHETLVDISKALKDQEYTVLKIFNTSNEFYKSLGLPTNEMSYGSTSMIERPADKKVLCHASAFDFCDGKDFRIKMCTEVNHEDFFTVHHEMGHIQYYIDYKDQPITFRSGANPGFHEAVGDTMSMSVQSPEHLLSIGLLSKFEDNIRTDINTLMSMALDKVAFLPFGLLIDKWRWDVFAGNVPEIEWNNHWWYLREKYQMVKPPKERTEENFDPAAKFHVSGDSQYISYFVSHILQFQFYKALCIEAGQYNPDTKQPPLHKCDFGKNEKAGKKLKAALSLGSSKPWPVVLKELTGTDDLDAGALLEYFEPLTEFLDDPSNSKYNSAFTIHKTTILFPILLFTLCKYFF